MKKQIYGSLIVGMSILLVGCVQVKPFTPKALNENAKGIATVKSTPYGCKVLGETTGFEQNRPDTGEVNERGYPIVIKTPTLAEARIGASNDLVNKAVEIAGKSKRVVLKIIDSNVTCLVPGACQNLQDNTPVTSYSLTAQVFECGNKEK